MHIRQFIGFTV